MTRLALWKMYNQTNGGKAANGDPPLMPPVSLPNLPALPSELLAQHAAQAAAAAQAEKSLNQQLASERKRVLEKLSADDGGGVEGAADARVSPVACDEDDAEERRTASPPQPKRMRGDEDGEETEDEEVAVGGGGADRGRRVEGGGGLEDDEEESGRRGGEAEELARKAAVGLLPGANIKITSRGALSTG